MPPFYSAQEMRGRPDCPAAAAGVCSVVMQLPSLGSCCTVQVDQVQEVAGSILVRSGSDPIATWKGSGAVLEGVRFVVTNSLPIQQPDHGAGPAWTRDLFVTYV